MANKRDQWDTPTATETAPDGANVLKEMVQMTGLSEEYLNEEISEFLGTTHTPVNELSLEQLRAALLNYLESVNEQINQELEGESSPQVSPN